MKRGALGQALPVLVTLGLLLPSTDASPAPKPYERVAAHADNLLEGVWEEAFLEAAPAAEDSVFLRRLSIDLRGVIPHADEVRRYAADPDPDKVAKWAGWFLDTPDHADYSAEIWEHLLLGRKGNPQGLDRDGFRRWLRESFLVNKPYDQLVREIVESEGLPEENPPVNFYLRYEADPVDLAGRVSRLFLGTRIECAECHDHPYADVKRAEFFGFAAFFARTDRYRHRDRTGEDTDRRGIREEKKGEMKMPPMKPGEEPVTVAPLFFGERPEAPGKKKPRVRKSTRSRSSLYTSRKRQRARRPGRPPEPPEEPRRRDELARWLTAPENRFFSRAIVNRTWARFMGKGFVNPIDDFSVDSKIVFPELLDYLAEDFVDSGYDLRRLIRIIVTTKAYRQKALRADPGGVASGKDHDFFSSVPIRPLEAEVIARSMLRAVGLESPHPERKHKQVREYVKEAYRIFEKRFGVDETEKQAEFQGTVLQVLLLFNGDFTSGEAPASRPFHPGYEKKLAGNLDVVLQGVAPEEQIERLFLNTLSRTPSPKELVAFEKHLVAARDDRERQQALADAQWALLNSAEFLHQH